MTVYLLRLNRTRIIDAHYALSFGRLHSTVIVIRENIIVKYSFLVKHFDVNVLT